MCNTNTTLIGIGCHFTCIALPLKMTSRHIWGKMRDNVDFGFFVLLLVFFVYFSATTTRARNNIDRAILSGHVNFLQ